MRPFIVVLVLASASAGCSSPSEACGDALGITRRPADTTLTVGQQFSPQILLSRCRGTVPVFDSFVWSAQDTTIVRVDPRTGLTTAIAPGHTQLSVKGATYGPILGPTVTVR